MSQRSPEWFAQRLGKITGSKFAAAMARSKKGGEKLQAWHDLVWQLVCERLSGNPTEGPEGFALKWGTEVEPYAREAYELHTGNIVTEVDFVDHPTLSFVGASPDGLIGEDGGIEIKCPISPEIHLKRFLEGTPEQYKAQIQGCMWVTGRKWWHFVSYHPRMAESHRLYLEKHERDEDYIQRLELAVIEVDSVACEILDKLKLRAA